MADEWKGEHLIRGVKLDLDEMGRRRDRYSKKIKKKPGPKRKPISQEVKDKILKRG